MPKLRGGVKCDSLAPHLSLVATGSHGNFLLNYSISLMNDYCNEAL